MRYPEVRRDDAIDEFPLPDGSVARIAAPYRWLEDADSDETRAFIEAQNAFAEPILAALPARKAFRERLSVLLSQPTRGVPRQRGGRLFAWHGDGRNQDVLVVADDADGLESARVLLDPNELSSDGTVAVTVSSPSPDGSLLAYGLADGGSDWRTIRVRDVATGEDLDDEIPWTKWNLPVWQPDGRSFTYWAYDAPSDDPLVDEMGAGRLMLHRIGTPVSEDELLFTRPEEPRTFGRQWPRDDEWFVFSTDTGSSSGNDLAVRRHDEPMSALRPLATGHEREWNAVGVRDDVLYVVTDADAPRYRLVAFDLAATDPAATLREVVPQHAEDVLLDAALTASGLVLTYSHDASHRMQLAAFDGALGDALPIGAGVSIEGSDAVSSTDTVFVKTQGFVDPGTRHEIVVDGVRIVSHRALPDPAAADVRATTTRIAATSKDGTVVPAFLVAPENAPDGPRPTLMWGYGGFNIPLNPAYRPLFAAWVQAGGTLVVPNLRGGGEFGSDWHKAGTKERKQNVFDDLYAVAERIIADGLTTPRQLALHGRSNGGLLAGAALTQRPELWAAVLPGVGVLDMLRFHRFTIGWAWTSDYGDPDDPETFGYLRAYSPLHNVVEGRSYPPTLITTGDHDDRVVPGHSFQFAATLQHAQGCDAPILLSVDTRAGHGMGKPRDAQVLEFADQLAFAARFTGLDA